MAARLTTYVVVAIVAATLIAGLIVGAQRDDNSGPVDLIIYNAKVYAADPLGSMAEAVAVRGNTILRVGTSRDILRYRRPQTTVIDAKGVAVVPGFNDAHASFIAGDLARDGVDLFDATTVDEMVRRVSEWSDAHPDAAWISGHGWTYEPFADLPMRTELDAVVSDRPVVLMSQDGHAAWVNTKALQAAGVIRRTAEPKNGIIVRDARTGEPTGLLKEAAIGLVARAMPRPTREERIRALRLAIRDAQEHGVTSVQDIGAAPVDLELYDEARRSGELTVRVYAGFPASGVLTQPGGGQSADGAKRYADDSLLKTGLAVIPLDGAIESETAALVDDYEPRAAGSGLLKLPPAEVTSLVSSLDKQKWQIAIQANGDRAVRVALDAYEAASAASAAPPRGRRHRIEGMELVAPDDLPRLRGLVASLQPLHGSADRLPVWRRRVGPDRATLGWATESLGKAGAHLAFGTDWPNLPLDPIAGLDTAVHRTSAVRPAETADEDQTPDPRVEALEKLPLKSAINAWTSGAAWASFDEHRKGVIKPGMLADLVVLSTDIFSGPPSRLASTAVDVTIFDGKVVYQRDQRHSTN